MDGWIDTETRHWKDLQGKIDMLVLNMLDQAMCPVCKAQTRDVVLLHLPELTAWGCADGHHFECVGIPR
jgi:hypothetical protein